MRALTIAQPYAELIARGDKPMENRTWSTRYRGPLLIHAGKSRAWLDPADIKKYPEMVFGAVVAVADLDACLELIYPADPHLWPEQYRHLVDHEHANGPICWMVPRARRLKAPVPWKGEQGLWTPPAELIRLVEAQL